MPITPAEVAELRAAHKAKLEEIERVRRLRIEREREDAFKELPEILTKAIRAEAAKGSIKARIDLRRDARLTYIRDVVLDRAIEILQDWGFEATKAESHVETRLGPQETTVLEVCLTP